MGKSRKPDYAALALGEESPEPLPTPPSEPPVRAPAPAASPAADHPEKRPKGRPRTDRSARAETTKAFPVYLDPDGHEALKIYAIRTKQRMGDIVLDWIEVGAREAGFAHRLKPRGD